MLTTVIPYAGNDVGLAQLLVNLQPQLHPDDDIYVIDFSRGKSAVDIVKKYGSTRCYIFVEVANNSATDEDIIKFGLQSMKENKQEGALLLYPTSVIATTFVANLKKAIKKGFDILFFNSLASLEMNPNFKWFTPLPHIVEGRKNLPQDIMQSRTAIFVSTKMIDDKFNFSIKKDYKLGYIKSELMVTVGYY